MGETDTATKPEHRCPECGGDATVVRQRPTRRLQRAVLIPTLVWSVFVLGGLFAASPWGQRAMGSPWTIMHLADAFEAARTSTRLFAPFFTAEDVLKDPDAVARQFQVKYESGSDHYSEDWFDSRVRFVFLDESVSVSDVVSRGFGGAWVQTAVRSVFSEPGAFEQSMDWRDYPPEAMAAGFFGPPREPQSKLSLNSTYNRLDGAQDVWRRISLLPIVTSIIATWLLVFAASKALSRFAPFFDSRRWKLASLLLVVAVTLLAGLAITEDARTYSPANRSMNPNPDEGRSEWMSGEEFTSLLLDAGESQQLGDAIARVAESAPPRQLLGYEIMQNYGEDFSVYQIQLSEHFPLGHVLRGRRFVEHQNGIQETVDLPLDLQNKIKLNTTPLHESIQIVTSTVRMARIVQLNWANIVIGFAVLWIVLRLLLWLGRVVNSRVQCRRANRGQCIFCAYPLSPDALAARWDDHPRGS